MSIPALLLAAALPGAFQELHADHAESSSFLKSNWNKYEENYHPSYVLDGDPKTAWVEGAEGDGVGESITIPLSTLKTARTVRLEIWNGYQKSKNLLEANAAPEKVVVVVLGADGRESGRKAAVLRRVMGKQSVEVPVTGGVSAVKIVVESVHAGKKYKDTCISDVRVFVDSDVPYNAKAEKAKRGALTAWVKERRATAAYFAKLPREYPYASARFDATTREPVEVARADHLVPQKGEPEFLEPKPELATVAAQLKTPFLAMLGSEDKALLQRLIALDGAPDAAMPEKGTWMSASVKGKPTKQPDNLWFLEDAAWATLTDVAFFEANGRAGKVEKLLLEGYSEFEDEPGELYVAGSITTTSRFVIKRADGSIAAVYSSRKSVREERATEINTTAQLLVYDEGQRVIARATTGLMSNDMMTASLAQEFSIQRFTWRDGKIAEVVSTSTSNEWIDGVKPVLLLRRETFTAGPSS